MTSYLSTIDNPQKAYCLGFFLNIENSQSSFAKYSYELTNIHPDEDNVILDVLKNVVDIIFDDNEDDEKSSSSSLSMTLIDDKTVTDINTSVKGFGKFSNEEKKSFLRGWYEYSHLMNENAGVGDLVLIRPKILDDLLITEIFDYVNIPYCRNPDKIIFKYDISK